MSLTKKIDFAIIFEVKNANPNGDPLNGNRPRTDYDGLGEITDVCIKRKIRNRLLDNGHNIFVQSDDYKKDEATSLRDRAELNLGKEFFKKPKDDIAKEACEKWFDVRAFGQLFAFSNKKVKAKDSEDSKNDANGVSIPIRGPVSIQSAFSIEPISISSTQITKSVNSEGDGNKKASDTMGMKHRVDKGIYTLFGSMNPQLSEKTGFNDADAEVLKGILPKLFENDASSARPEGSMNVLQVFWWQHNCKSGQHSSAKVHGTLKVNADGTFNLDKLSELEPEIIPGF